MTLDQLKAICDAARPATAWTFFSSPEIESGSAEDTQAAADAKFFTSARTEMPKLIERIQRLEAALAVAREEFGFIHCARGYVCSDSIKKIDALLSEGTKAEDK
jgi:hypothetical protein